MTDAAKLMAEHARAASEVGTFLGWTSLAAFSAAAVVSLAVWKRLQARGRDKDASLFVSGLAAGATLACVFFPAMAMQPNLVSIHKAACEAAVREVSDRGDFALAMKAKSFGCDEDRLAVAYAHGTSERPEKFERLLDDNGES